MCITNILLLLSETHHHLGNYYYYQHMVCAIAGFWKRTAKYPQANTHLEKLCWSSLLMSHLLDGRGVG